MKRFINLILIVLVSSVAMNGQVLIGAKQAKELMRDKNVLVISARKATDYKKVHITGAVNIEHSKLYNAGSILKPVGEMTTILSKSGVSSDKHIILYDDGSMKYSGRMYWIFKYLGVKNVSIVEGGMKAWRIARLPVTKNPTPVKQANFVAKVNKRIYADFNHVKTAQNSSAYVLVDVRSEGEYKGISGNSKKPGHVPGAVNLPHDEILNTNGTLKSKNELTSIFGKLKIDKSKTIILYCETSVRAGIVFVALKEVLNYPNVKVYDGAYTEWQEKGTVELGE